MLKRLTWASAGLVAGFGASKWLEHQARKRLRRYLGEHAGPRYVVAAGGELRSAASTLRGALAVASEEGRRAMEQRERDLRARLPRPSRDGRTTPERRRNFDHLAQP